MDKYFFSIIYNYNSLKNILYLKYYIMTIKEKKIISLHFIFLETRIVINLMNKNNNIKERFFTK